MILCKDCKYSVLYRGNVNPTCLHPQAVISLNYYDGNHKHQGTDSMRTSRVLCGEDAKFFEPIELTKSNIITKLVRWLKNESDYCGAWK